jgi:hypothetical protein
MIKKISFTSIIREVGNKENPSYVIPIDKFLIKSNMLNSKKKYNITCEEV